MSSPAEQNALVRQLIRAGNFREAAEACDLLNQQHPEFEAGWYTASQLAMAINEPMVAVSAIDRALQLSPGKPEWLIQRVECLGVLGDMAAARATAEQLPDHRFESAEVSAAFALNLSRLGMYAAARHHYLRAVELDPGESQYYYNLASVERYVGNIEAANDAVTRCLELQPDDEDAHLLRAGLNTQTTEANNIDSLLTAYERADGYSRRQVKLCYALAKELEDTRDFPRSFEFLSKGASLRRGNMRYTPQKDLDAMQGIQNVYLADMFDGHIDGYVNAEPIFVIGMPRTGTTLVERILGSHSVVYSAGELQTFSLELVKHCQKVSDGVSDNAGSMLQTSVSIDFAALGEDYIAATRPQTGKTAHFIDKLPLNFLYAGLIHLALPKAKIVLLERDPMDTCYAVYKALFAGIYPFSYDQKELANYFVAYRQLIDHWQTVMPDVMHVVKYEELVTTPRPVIEGLLSACSLSWEEDCMRFYDSLDASTTASAVQVRSDVSQTSIGKWRNYEEQLKPVSDILGEFL